MLDVGLAILIVLAAAFMLIRGDPKWIYPVIAGALALFLIPIATQLIVAAFTPKGAPVPTLFEWRQGQFFPYPYPAGSLGAELERNYAAIHRAYEALLAVQRASLTALFAVAYTETFIAVASSFTPVGAIIQASKFVAYLAQIGDPLLQISLTTFNAATAGVMIFHFLDLMARLAVRMAAPLLALALLAMIFKPTRALGGALYFFALAMVVSSYIGYYLSPTAESFTAWGLETAKWLNATAANATGTAPVPLLAVEGTPNVLYLATYNNTFVAPSPEEIAAKVNETLGPYNITVPESAVAGAVDLARQYRFFDKAAFNGTDWVAATAGSITPVAYGNKTWNATAVLDWLNFPAPAPEEGGCVLYGDFREFLDYLMPPKEAQKEKAYVGNLSSAICRFHQWLGFRSYLVYVRPPPFWRLLAVDIRYTALGEHDAVVGGGAAKAWDGVWGWLPGSGPDGERCLNALGNESGCAVLDTTIRAGLYNFSLWNLRGIGAKAAVDPVAGGVADYFNLSLPKASLHLNKTIYLYTWTEVCTWTQGNKTYTSSRRWWDAYSARKVDANALYNVSAVIYGRPWVVKEPENYTAQVPVVERSWDVSVWSEAGPWDGPTPPENATCTTEDRHVYKTIYVYSTAPRARVLYGFWWLRGGLIYVEPRGSALPGVLWDNSTSAAYVEGAEGQFYCTAATVPASTPEAASTSSPIPGVRDALDRLTSQDYLELVVIRNVSLAYLSRAGFFGLAQAAGRMNSSLMRAAVRSGEEYLAFINESPAALPMYYAVPSSYQAENFLVACAMYDWRNSTVVNGSLELAPGREWWAAAYPMGDSKVAEAVIAAKADMFRYVFGMPPPPPPANLSGFVKQWRIPWNNRSLPYQPYYGPGMRMPPRDNSTGIPLWNIQNLEDVQITQGNIVGWLFTVLFVTILSIAAVFEFLGALLDFPTPAREVWGFVTGVIQDWTYWLPFRVAVRGRILARMWRAVKRPVMRQTVRIAARVHALAASRIPGLRYIRSPDLKEYYREYVKRRRDIAVKDPAEQIREEIDVKWRREALERVLRAMEERADVEWMRNLERRREEERRRMLEAARRIWNAIKADNMIEVVRELPPPRFDAWLQERVEMSRGSLSYHLFWWRLDRLPFMWRSLLRLDPHVIARLEAEGRIKPEEAEALRNLRAAVEAYVAELRWGWARLHSVPQYVKAAEEEFEKARQRMAQEAEKGLADFRRFIADFERRYETLRRYFSGDEGERAEIAEEAKKAVERLVEALRHFALMDKAPRARLVSALNEALRHVAEGRAPQIPRDASVEDVVKGLALMDFDLAVKALRSAERYLEAHYAVAPTRYDTRQIAAEIVRWHIEERIPTLKLAGLARGIALGARGAEEGEVALRSWSGRPAARRVEDAPWEAVAHRASLLREQRANAAEAVRIRPDVVLAADYARYLAGFRVEGEALDALRKAVEYRRVLRMLERAEELRMPPTAVERLAAEAERLRREVLRETSQIYRRFSEEFFFVKDLVEGRRVVRREVPEVRDVVRAFEESLAQALREPERRERAFRELFTERVERLAEELNRRGDVEGAERVRRAAAELARISESVGWRAVEDVSVVLPAVARAFEEAYSEARSPSELARAFRAKAEEAARRFEQQGMGDVAARIRRAAERIAGEVGDRASVERMRALLSPERAGRAIEGLELLRRLLSNRGALDAYRNRSGEAGKAAEELDKARRVAEELGLKNVVKALERPDGKRIAKALGELERELARLYGALELAEYVRRPRADAEFGRAWAVARILGLEEADRLFEALSRASLFLLREGREVFRNPLYDEVKHLIDEERVRALVRAPLYSYVVDRLGPDVLRPTYARWYGLFADYGPYLSTAFEHARTSPAKAGAPLGLAGGFSYARKMMGWLGDFSRESVARGLKAYYRGEGRPFRELSEMTIRGAKVQLYEKAAELARARSDHLLSESKAAGGEAAERLRAEAEGLRLLAAALRAKAAYEEVRLVQTYLRGAERRAEALLREAKSAWGVEARLELERRAREGLEAARKRAERHLADARARYRAHMAEVRDFVRERGDVREVAVRYFGLTARAFAGDPQEVAERMAKAVDVRRVISWADELKLPRELGETAIRIADAERIYARFEKVLRAKAEPIPPAYDLEKAQHFFAEGARPQPPPRSRLEEAVPRAVRDVFAAYYAKLREAAERAAVYLALVRNDGRYARKEVERARQALLRALRAGSREEALKALEDLKKALKALGIDVEGDSPEAFVKAVEERARPAYEEYLAARREYLSAVDAIARFSPEAALALGEAAREAGPDPVARWMALTAYEAGERALREYAQHWAKPLEERWDSLPQAVREIIARREEEAAGEVLRRALRSAGVIVKRDAAADLAALEGALAKVFTANGEWGYLGEYVKQAVEAARRVQRGEASTDELARAVDALLAAYGVRAAERFVESDRLEDAVDELREAMGRYARGSGLRMGREAAERALLLGLSAVPQEHVEAYARGGWRGRIEPYVAYWTEDEGLARRAGEAGWEVRQIKRPVSFEEGVPKEWRTAYVVAPRGLDLSAVERAVTELVDGAPEGIAYIRPAEWPAPEPFIWYILRDRMPARDGDQIVAYSIDRLSIEEPLSKFGEALRARDYGGARRAVGELYEARLNRTAWQIVYEFDRPRARDALEHLRKRYGEPYERLWERHDELYLTWLAFRLADEFESYLRSGAGRELRAKEEAADILALGRWLPVDLAPLFWLRLAGDPEGGPEFKAVWITALNTWFERMAEPYTPKKPAVARRALELFNAFMGAGLKYEELFPPPPQRAEAAGAVKPAKAEAPVEAAKPAKPEQAEALKPEVRRPVEAARAEAVRPSGAVGERGLRPSEKPAVEGLEPAESEAVEPAVRGLRREAARPEAVKQAAEVRRPAVEKRGLRQLGERPRAPIADVIPDGALEIVDHLVERFGLALDREAAFKAEGFAIARVKARIEKAAAREPEFAHILGEVAEDVLRSLGRLMASPDAARHARDALLYLFEGYQTKDGERLYARIEPAIREAVRRAEEAGIPDAEYRIKQFVLEILDVLARAGERYRRQALEGISTVEKALRATAFAGLSAAAAYSAYHGLYSDAVVSSVASAIALADAGQFREAVEYVRRAAKALYEAARDVFERARVAAERLAELFVEAVARVLAWIDAHKAYLFLAAAVAAGLVAASTAMSLWGSIELGALAHAASLMPFIALGGVERSREEALNLLKGAPDPYGKFLEVAREANAGRIRLAEPWNSLRMLVLPTAEERKELARSRAYDKLRGNERMKRALFYAALALEEALGIYKAASRRAAGLEEAVRREEVGEGPFKRVIYVPDLGRLERLAEEEEAFGDALRVLRERLNEYAVKYDLGDLLDVDEDTAKRLAEAKAPELPEFGDANFGVKAYAALIAYREHALGRRGAYGTAARYWLEEGGAAWLLYYAPKTAYKNAEKAGVERPAAVEEMIAEALRRLFLKPGADRYSLFVEELTKGGKLALELKKENKKSYVFKLYRLEEGGKPVELEGAKLRIVKVGEEAGRAYFLELDARWREFFGHELEIVWKAAEELRERWPIEDPLPYMLGWSASDVSIHGERSARELYMTSSHFWQVVETKTLFGWSDAVRLHVGLTLEGPKLQLLVHASLSKLDEAVRRSAEGGWLSKLGIKAESWDELKRWAIENWRDVVEATVRHLGGDIREELEELGKRLDDDKVAREAVAPALLLIQAERLGNDEKAYKDTLRYFAAAVSGAVGGDGHVSAAGRGEVSLASGERPIALLWGAAFRAHGIRAEVEGAGTAFQVVASGGDAVRLARLYLLFGPPLLEGGDERVINHKLDEAVKLGAKGALNIRWEGLRRTQSGIIAADLTISEGGVEVKYNAYLRKDDILLQFRSTDHGRAELAARLLRRAGVSAEVRREGGRDVWYVKATTDSLAAGRKELRDAIAEVVRAAVENGWVDAGKAERWLDKLEGGITLREGWPRYSVQLVEGALVIRYQSTSPDSIEREARRLRDMGLEEGRHFSVRVPEGGRDGCVSILREGLAYAAWLSVHGSEGQREFAAEFVGYILQRAREEGEEVYEKAEEVVEGGKAMGSLKLEGFEKVVDGRLVRVVGGGARFEEGGSGRTLLRITITAEVDGVRSDYTMTFSRRGADNAALGRAYIRVEKDVERFSALVEALTDEEPGVYRMKDGTIVMECGRGHLDGFKRYAELADPIARWLEETGR